MTTRPRLLDLFCCEGGAAAGYTAAGFDVDGVDIVDGDPAIAARRTPDMRDRYLAAGGRTFNVGDAMTWPLDGYDAVHASPPCHDHSDLRTRTGKDHGTGWMLAGTVERLTRWGGLWVVENVESAHMPGAITLCGSEFGLGADTSQGGYRYLRRHRQFLSNAFLMGAGGCHCSGLPVVGVYGTGGGGPQPRGYKASVSEAREVMGMPWASRHGVSQAIPPAYTRFIGEQLITALEAMG